MVRTGYKLGSHPVPLDDRPRTDAGTDAGTDTIKVYTDSTLQLTVTDDDPLPPGGVAFGGNGTLWDPGLAAPCCVGPSQGDGVLRTLRRVKGRIKKVVTNSGDLNATIRYYYDGQKIIETRDGSGNLYQQFIAPLTRRPPRCGDAALRHAGFACCGESRVDDP